MPPLVIDRSVPQMPQRWTLITTSSGRGSGSGMVSIVIGWPLPAEIADVVAVLAELEFGLVLDPPCHRGARILGNVHADERVDRLERAHRVAMEIAMDHVEHFAGMRLAHR